MLIILKVKVYGYGSLIEYLRSMCETLHLFPSIKRERKGKGRKEEKGEDRGEGSREEGQETKRRREKGGEWGKEEDRGEGKEGRGEMHEQFLSGWDTRLALQGLMPMLHLKYRPFVLEFSSACHYIYRTLIAIKRNTRNI